MRRGPLSPVSSGSSSVNRNHWEEVCRKGYRRHFFSPAVANPPGTFCLVSVYSGDMFCLILQRVIQRVTHVDVDANPSLEWVKIRICTVTFLKPNEIQNDSHNKKKPEILS